MEYPDKNNVRVIIPTKNEGASIGSLLRELQTLNYTKITVVDGHSEDGTCDTVREEYPSVTLIEQDGHGKGQALRQVFAITEEPYILMMDADGTNPPGYGYTLVNYAANGYDHVIGNRLACYEKGAFKTLNICGNIGFNAFFKQKTGEDMKDILSGFRAFKTEAVKKMELKTDGFEIETEMCLETIRKNLTWTVVDTPYRKRTGKSNLHPFKDGKTIMALISAYKP